VTLPFEKGMVLQLLLKFPLLVEKASFACRENCVDLETENNCMLKN